jgi:hypothetical protein
VDENENNAWEPQNPDDSPAYPEHSGKLTNHRFTVSVDNRGPHIAVRGQTAQEIAEGYQELIQAGVPAMLSTVYQQGAPAPQAPQQSWQGQQQYPQATQQPNQPYQGQPAWQQQGAPQGQGGGNRAEPKPRPTDWPQVFRVTVPRGDQNWKNWRQQNQHLLKGMIRWAGGGDFWVHPSVQPQAAAAGFMMVPA